MKRISTTFIASIIKHLFNQNIEYKLIISYYTSTTYKLSRLIFTNGRSARKKTELETRRARQIQSIDKSKVQDDYVVDSVRQLSVTSWAILIEKSHRSGNEARREMKGGEEHQFARLSRPG